MVMAVINDVCPGLNRVKVVLFHSLDYCFIGYDLVFADYDPLSLVLYLGEIIPLACSYLRNFKSCFWVDVEDIS